MIHKKINKHFRRFEFKYFLEKSVADRIIPELMNYMEWDDFVGEKEYYECHSLYFDNEKLKAYHEKIEGQLNRKKVRVRTYKRKCEKDDLLFFEIKRKSGEVVLKDREVLPEKFLKKFIEDPFSLLQEKNLDLDFLNEIVFEVTNYQLKPTLLVSYKRKPFFAKNDSRFRVTFDYDLEFAKAKGASYQQTFQKLEEDFVIMEVKFNANMPKWFHQLIEVYRLQRTGSCKYCFGIDLIKETQSTQCF